MNEPGVIFNRTQPLIVQLLLAERKMQDRHLSKVMEMQATQNLSIESAITQASDVDDEAVAKAYSSYLKLPLIDRDEIDISSVMKARRLIPEKILRERMIIPLGIDGSEFRVAMVDPTDVLILQEIQLYTLHPIRPFIATLGVVEDVLNEVFGTRDILREIGASQGANSKRPEMERNSDSVLNLNRPLPAGDESQVAKIVNHILAEAVRGSASDIHIEPFASEAKVRLRIDGVLQDISPPPMALYLAVISRFKILSKMDIAERRLPQDGAFTISFDNKETDLRVSSIPVVWGEKIVIRLLNKEAIEHDLASLGFSKPQHEAFLKAAESENGLVLVTGPTGSGKSTTLYATINLVRTPGTNVSTIEDPVEYKVQGINQVQVNKQVGLTFASGLRAFLRQDPDVILVGEVRDKETTKICMKAALTGHLVLSTLHANDALAAVARLVDLGVEPFVVASTLRLVEAQRLLRRLCTSCKRPVEVTSAFVETYGLDLGTTIYEPVGCKSCTGSGYKGRVGAFEVILIDEKLRQMIQESTPIVELRKYVKSTGVKLLAESAMEKVQQGTTSLQEVLGLGD